MTQSLRILVTALVLALTTFGMEGGQEASARSRAKAKARVNVKELSKLMGAFRFGMTKAQVLKALEDDVGKRYDKQIFATSDVYQQDKLRRERAQELERVRSSYVEFEGNVTGWDVSLIDDQFAHKTGESMMVYWEVEGERSQRRFFFFFEGRLYKMVQALDASIIEKSQRNFATFKSLMQRRYGEAREHDSGLSWVTKKFMVLALDKLTHYDALCMVIAEPGTSRRVMQERAQRKQKVEKRSPVIRAMIDTTDEGPGLDENANVIDIILNRKE